MYRSQHLIVCVVHCNPDLGNHVWRVPDPQGDVARPRELAEGRGGELGILKIAAPAMPDGEELVNLLVIGRTLSKEMLICMMLPL